MGTFRRHDCPHLMPGGNMCKYKMDKIMDRTDLTYNQKLFYMQISTCSGCEIYKNLKKCGKPQKIKNAENGKKEKIYEKHHHHQTSKCTSNRTP